jgi:hypothetical protein
MKKIVLSMQKLHACDDNTKQQKTCVLCGLAVEIDGFLLTTPNGIQTFCCAGCLSVYQLLNDDNTETSLLNHPLNHEDNKK